ncbi:MAG: radical SAM protein [Bacteroidota bacterium]
MQKLLPSYLSAFESGKLDELRNELYSRMESCTLCPRNCNVNRLGGEMGTCNTGSKAMVSSYGPHYGEEDVLVGRHGSGTIFFTNCNLLCTFCQNYDISHQGRGREVSDEEIAGMMLELQSRGCHNINFVTPSHVIPQIVGAVSIASEKGLKIPLVYNSGGYDSVESIKLLDGIIDIYMPDLKFSDPDIAERTCDARDYFDVARKAIKEMHRQVGDLETNDEGIAYRGLMIRHLIMPENVAGTERIMEFIAEEISVKTYINIMDQYYPRGKVKAGSKIDRPITYGEDRNARKIAMEKGLERISG